MLSSRNAFVIAIALQCNFAEIFQPYSYLLAQKTQIEEGTVHE